MTEMLGTTFMLFMKLLPAVVIFTLFFSFEGNLRWLGLLGFIPLILVFSKGCTACMDDNGPNPEENGWRHGTGH